MNPKLDPFFDREKRWQPEFKKLREIVLDLDLDEELKWGQACYAADGKNVVLIHGFKEYCALLFLKGALLKDPKGILIQQTKNVQAARQIRFTSVPEIVKLAKTLKAYVREAVENERAGATVEMKTTAEFDVPQELQARLDSNPGFKKAFRALTPGRQRAYILNISQAKQSSTRESRIDKHIPRIMKGLGLND